MGIWKVTLQCADLQSFDLPKGAKPLTVQVQDGRQRMWLLVDEEAETEQRTFATYGTGHRMPVEPGTYIGSYQLAQGLLMFHVFEVQDELTNSDLKNLNYGLSLTLTP